MNFNSLEETVRICLSVDDYYWELMTLSQDLMFRFFEEDQIPEIIRQSALCGVQEAERVLKEGGGKPTELAKEYGIDVELCSPDKFRNPKVVNYAQFSKGKTERKILVSSVMSHEMKRAVESLECRERFGDFDPVEVLTGHELFHHIQESKPALPVNTMKVPITQLKVIRRKITPLQISEIAAFAFVKRLLDLPYYPRMVEILGLWKRQNTMALKLASKLCALSGITREAE